MTQVFTVTISNDALVEGPETGLLALSSPVQASLGVPSSAALTIADDDFEYRLYLPLAIRP